MFTKGRSIELGFVSSKEKVILSDQDLLHRKKMGRDVREEETQGAENERKTRERPRERTRPVRSTMDKRGRERTAI